MEKQLVVDGVLFDFFLFEEFQTWRCYENNDLIKGVTLDLEIDLNIVSEFNWDDVADFILFLRHTQEVKQKNISSSKVVLKSYYNELFKGMYPALDKVSFTLSSVNYKGHCKNVNLRSEFEYDFVFFPEQLDNPHFDSGSFNWISLLRDNLFLGVYCDRI